jgi:hypothetical protein
MNNGNNSLGERGDSALRRSPAARRAARYYPTLMCVWRSAFLNRARSPALSIFQRGEWSSLISSPFPTDIPMGLVGFAPPGLAVNSVPAFLISAAAPPYVRAVPHRAWQ